jgi:hypothetical protein
MIEYKNELRSSPFLFVKIEITCQANLGTQPFEMPTMLSYPQLEFHFLVSDPLSQKQPSRLFINKVTKENYEWKLVTSGREVSTSEIVNINSMDMVIQRIRAMLELIQYDEEPFDSIAIHFPGFPTIRVLHDRFTTNSLMKVIHHVFENWTVSMY